MAEDDKKSKIRDIYAIRSDKVKAYIENAIFPDAKKIIIENIDPSSKPRADVNKYSSTQFSSPEKESKKITPITPADEDCRWYGYKHIYKLDFEVLEEIVSYSKSKSIDDLLSHGAVGFEDRRVAHLRLGQYKLSALPESIGKLINLEKLYLYDNQLTHLPENIGKLVNLHKLNLDKNRLEETPESIGNLVNLEMLYLNDNQLMEIPESIGELINLEKLGLWDNQLTEIPESIGKLANLKELHLYDNPLSESAKKKLEELKGKRNNLDVLYDLY